MVTQEKRDRNQEFLAEAYQKFLDKRVCPKNSRERSNEENFFAALNTVDMKATPERNRTLEALRRLF